MAETIYLSDGSMACVSDEKDVFLERLLRERLGDDAARFFHAYIAETLEDAAYAEEAQREAERAAEGYLALCRGALAALRELKHLAHEEHLNRAAIQKAADEAYLDLYQNL